MRTPASYAAVEERPEVALDCLRALRDSGDPLNALPAALEILRLDPADEVALRLSLQQRELRPGWEAYLGQTHSRGRPREDVSSWAAYSPGAVVPGLDSVIRSAWSEPWTPEGKKFASPAPSVGNLPVIDG